jgi:hypothetical protein
MSYNVVKKMTYLPPQTFTLRGDAVGRSHLHEQQHLSQSNSPLLASGMIPMPAMSITGHMMDCLWFAESKNHL